MATTQAFLDAHGISQTELGEALGLQRAAVSRKLAGLRNWKLGEVQEALAFFTRRLGRTVTFDEVFADSDWSADADASPAADAVVGPVAPESDPAA